MNHFSALLPLMLLTYAVSVKINKRLSNTECSS